MSLPPSVETMDVSRAAARRAAARRRLGNALVRSAFITPALLLLAVTIGLPMVTAVWLSLNRVKLVPPGQAFMGFQTSAFGLGNFAAIISSPDVRQAFLRTLLFTVGTVSGATLLGLALALLLNSNIRARALWRMLLVAPWVVAPVVAASNWRWIFDVRYGVLNDLLQSLHIIQDPVPWLISPSLVLWSITAANIWLRAPFMMVFILAALQAIPQEQYEAVAVDGAGRWASFRYVTLPHLRFAITIAGLLQTIWSFKDFDIIQVMTGGGPAQASEVLTTLIYRMSFSQFDFGTSSAIGVLMTVVLLICAIVYLRLLRQDT